MLLVFSLSRFWYLLRIAQAELVHLETKYLVRPLWAERVFPIFQGILYLELVEIVGIQPGHLHANRLRPSFLFGGEEHLAMAVLAVQFVERQLVGRNFLRLKQKNG